MEVIAVRGATSFDGPSKLLQSSDWSPCEKTRQSSRVVLSCNISQKSKKQISLFAVDDVGDCVGDNSLPGFFEKELDPEETIREFEFYQNSIVGQQKRNQR